MRDALKSYLALASGLTDITRQRATAAAAAAGVEPGAIAAWLPLTAAVLLGLPALRLRGLTLAVSTLAFASAVVAILLNPDQLGRHLPETLDRPQLLGMSLDDARTFYYVALAVLLLAVGAVMGLRRSRTARVLVAARDNEPAAQSFGISLLRARLSAFAVSGFLAALAGVLFAYQQGNVTASGFSVEQSLLLFTFTVIGGLGSVAGPLVGFAALAVLSLSTHSPSVLATVNGLGGIALLLLAPGGLAQVGLDLRDGMLRRIARRAGIVVPSLAQDGGGGVAPIAPSSSFVPRRYALDGHDTQGAVPANSGPLAFASLGDGERAWQLGLVILAVAAGYALAAV